MAEGVGLSSGALVETIRSGQQVHDNMRVAPGAVDIMCKNTSGGNLVGAVAGSDWVEIDVADYAPGARITCQKLTASGSSVNRAALGVVHWQAGTVGDGEPVIVRIYGVHPYAKVDGTTDVADGDSLSPFTTAGQAAKAGAAPEANQVVGYARAAAAADEVAAISVLLLNPSNLIVA